MPRVTRGPTRNPNNCDRSPVDFEPRTFNTSSIGPGVSLHHPGKDAVVGTVRAEIRKENRLSLDTSTVCVYSNERGGGGDLLTRRR